MTVWMRDDAQPETGGAPERPPKRQAHVNLRHMRCFIVAATRETFAAAAAELSTTPSALTTTIKQLENELGIRLFDRTTRRVELTAAGADFLPSAQRLVRDFNLAMDEMRATAGGMRGHIGIATYASVMNHIVRPAFVSFASEFPKIGFTIRDGIAKHIHASVRDGAADIGISSRWKDARDLDFEPFLHDQLGVLCRHDHPLLAAPEPIRWEMLSPFPYVALTSGSGTRNLLDAIPGIRKILPEPTHEVLSYNILQPVLEIPGFFAIIPALLAASSGRPDLAFRRLQEPVIEREIFLIRSRNRELQPAARKFLHHLRREFPRMKLPDGVRFSG